MSFLWAIAILDPEIRVGAEQAAEGAPANAMRWISCLKPDDILALARDASLEKVQYI